MCVCALREIIFSPFPSRDSLTPLASLHEKLVLVYNNITNVAIFYRKYKTALPRRRTTTAACPRPSIARARGIEEIAAVRIGLQRTNNTPRAVSRASAADAAIITII